MIAPGSSSFLSGGGVTGELMRSVDWARTEVGPVEAWPGSLRTVVGILLHSRQPMFLWWGPELIQFYNDAYLPSLGAGKHPAAMGGRGRDTWPEIWSIIGPQIEEVMSYGEATWHEDALVPIFRNGKTEDVYWTYGYSPVFNEAGGIGGALVVCTETTERVLWARQEHAARQIAEVANRAKDDFLATVSHELRTPLTAILGWARMLIDGKISPTRREHALNVIERNAVAQARLIDDLLDVSRIIAGYMRLHLTEVDIVRVLESAIDSVRPALDAKGIDLHTRFGPVGSHVLGDPTRLQQVIWNLLVNAAKFTHTGGRVEVVLSSAASLVELRVIDNGRGIPVDFLPRVFDRFKQAETGSGRSQGGLGLGLAISRHLVELHRGSLEAHSEGEGRGASFVLTLPLAPVPAPWVPGSSRDGAPSSADIDELEGLRVLVLDDEEQARERVVSILSKCGAILIDVQNAADALEALVQYRPDVLISDIAMPVEDGYSFIRRVRRLPPESGAGTPAAALTVFASAEDRAQALEAGYQIHLAKPAHPGELVAAVASLARIARSME